MNVEEIKKTWSATLATTGGFPIAVGRDSLRKVLAIGTPPGCRGVEKRFKRNEAPFIVLYAGEVKALLIYEPEPKQSTDVPGPVEENLDHQVNRGSSGSR